MKNSSTTKKVPTDRKQSQISRRGHCDVGSNNICSDACVVVATDPVLKNAGVSDSFNQILKIEKTEKKRRAYVCRCDKAWQDQVDQPQVKDPKVNGTRSISPGTEF